MNTQSSDVPRKLNTLVAVFDDRVQAENAVDALDQAGFPSDAIGFAIRGEDVTRGGMITDAVGAKDAKGAAVGAVSGGVLGGVLGAAASLLIPGVGPVVAAGILTMTFGGAVAGTAIGGIFGALTGLEISEAEARFLETEFQSGKAIVAVKAGTRTPEAAEIFRRHGGYDMHKRGGQSPITTEGVFSQP